MLEARSSALAHAPCCGFCSPSSCNQGLISKANKHVESTLAPSASLADYKAAYTSYFKSNPDFKVARLAPFVRLRKEKMRIQRGSLLHVRACGPEA